MKFSCSRDQLDKQLGHISRIITVRSGLPVLSNVLLETDGALLRMSGTDLEIAVATHLSAEVEQEGTFTVPAKLFQEFVRQNPDDTLSFRLESFDLVCTGEKVTARLPGLEADEFPSLPQVANGKRFTLPLGDFVDAMKQVVIACAADPTRPVLTGVLCVLSGETATFVATDSFRLVERTMAILPTQEDVTFLLPGRTIQEVIRIAGTLTGVNDLELEISDQQALLRIGTVEVYSRLIVGAFPKYQAIIPKKFVAVADVTTSELVQALRLSSIFGQSGVTNVMLEIGADGSLAVATHGSQRGSTRNAIYALLQDGFEPLKAAFNARFLLDALSASGAPTVQLRFSGASSPMIVATDDPAYLQLVMPIRVDA
jgi:DNA polymerase-3 subunit beta